MMLFTDFPKPFSQTKILGKKWEKHFMNAFSRFSHFPTFRDTHNFSKQLNCKILCSTIKFQQLLYGAIKIWGSAKTGKWEKRENERMKLFSQNFPKKMVWEKGWEKWEKGGAECC